MNIKISREVKVGIVAVICLVLLYFGFNFLKGVNIFSAMHSYQGVYPVMNGLTEQSPVYIKGYKVGQVDAIAYDFGKDSSFTVTISVNRDIVLPEGTTMDLIADGLLGGSAIALSVPVGDDLAAVENHAVIPTRVIPGLMDNLQEGLLSDLDSTILAAQAMIEDVRGQLEGDHIKRTLTNVDKVTGDLTKTSASLKTLMTERVPVISYRLDTVLANLDVVSQDIREADVHATIARVDTAVNHVNYILADVRSQEGTLGQLIYDKTLYANINATVVSADSLLTDLKANPRRYVHFSLIGGKDKTDKKEKKK